LAMVRSLRCDPASLSPEIAILDPGPKAVIAEERSPPSAKQEHIKPRMRSEHYRDDVFDSFGPPPAV
jgi:hypothetical protein